MDNRLTSFLKLVAKKVRRARRGPLSHVGLIVSHPKAGRTWLRVMLDDLGLAFECTHDGSGTDRPFEGLKPGRKTIYRQKPVVFMLRDPRDTLVSYYFQRTLRTDRFEGTIHDFIRSPVYGIEKVVLFNLAWLQLGRDLPAFIPITYEMLKSSPIDVVRSVVDLVGETRSDSDLARVCSDNTFEKMKAREGSGEYNDRRLGLRRRESDDPDLFKVRRGKIGGYTDYLSAEDVDYCEEVLRRHSYWERCAELMPKPKLEEVRQ